MDTIIDPPPAGQYVIYALVDPTDEKVYYVGQTRNPQRRLEQHMAARHRQSEKGEWLRRLRQKGQQPLMQILETVTDEDVALEKEQEWIRYFLAKKMPLFNAQARPKQGNARPHPPVAKVSHVQTIIAGARPVISVQMPDGHPGVTLRSLCAALSLDYSSQYQRVRRTATLREMVQWVTLDTPGGPQAVEVIPAWVIPIWLAGLQVNRLTQEKRNLILAFQRESVAAIERAFAR